VRTMARRKAKRGGRRAKSIPIMPLIPIAGVAVEAMKYDSAQSKIATVSKRLIGYDLINHKLELSAAVPFWVGEGVAIVGHKVANKTGINNYVRRMSFGYLSL